MTRPVSLMSPRRRISTPRFLKISGGRRTTTLRSVATRISVWGTLLDVTLGTIACVLLLLGLLLLSIVHTRRSRARVKSAAHRRPIPASSTARAQRLPPSYRHPRGGVRRLEVDRHPTPLPFDDQTRGAFVNCVIGAQKISI